MSSSGDTFFTLNKFEGKRMPYVRYLQGEMKKMEGSFRDANLVGSIIADQKLFQNVSNDFESIRTLNKLIEKMLDFNQVENTQESIKESIAKLEKFKAKYDAQGQKSVGNLIRLAKGFLENIQETEQFKTAILKENKKLENKQELKLTGKAGVVKGIVLTGNQTSVTPGQGFSPPPETIIKAGPKRK